MAEITFLANVLHWPLSTLLDLEHADRHRLVDLVSSQEPVGSSPVGPIPAHLVQ